MLESIAAAVAIHDKLQMPLWKIFAADQYEMSFDDPDDIEAEASSGRIADLLHTMGTRYAIMKEGAAAGLAHKGRSKSGLSGGDSSRLLDYVEGGESLCGMGGQAAVYALAVNEVNASMGRIVAAPTAGSCGILPGVLMAAQEHFGYSDEQMARALLLAGGIGMIIAHRATLSGAEGGCQAECGAASAMAAYALTWLRGGTHGQCGDALGLAMKSVMGLVCDPVAGLVEVPCVKRNGFGATTAVLASDMALAGIESMIPPDEIIDVMKAVGAALTPALRETSDGGLATSPTGKLITRRLKEQGIV